MRLIGFLIIFFLLSGCSNAALRRTIGHADQSNEETVAEWHQYYFGKTEDEMILELGAPTKTEEIASFKVYYYFTDRGYSGHSSASAFGGAAFGNSSYRHHFRQSRFYFKEGKVVKWDYERS